MPLKPGANPYKILDLQKGCTEKEIQKAYRAQCLKWHPDKNLNNKEEAERRFIEAKEAFDFLYDKEKRAEYDKGEEKVRVAQENYDKRMAKADGDRRKLIEELERREKEFNGGKRPQDAPPTATQQAKKKKTEKKNFQDEIDAIRRQLEREVNEEVKQKANLMRTEREKHQAQRDKMTPQLLVKWKVQDGKKDYDEEEVRRIFENYGPISSISSAIIKKDRRKRIVEYEPGTNAWGAELETGSSPMPEFTSEWLKPPVDTVKKTQDRPTAPAASSNLDHMSLEDLEAQFMMGEF